MAERLIVLRDRPELVRAFIYAPDNYRISLIAELYGDSTCDAQKNMKKSDKARRLL